MGFDMQLVEEPENYPTDYEPQEPDEPANYRFAAGTIGICLAVMHAAEVLDADQPAPNFPSWPPAGIDAKRASMIRRFMKSPEQLRERLAPDEYQLVQAYQQELCSVTAVVPSIGAKVAEFKFLSNDGWWLSPRECRLIWEGLERLLRMGHEPLFNWLRKEGYSEVEAREFIRLWAGYNRLAADCGGYRVY